MTPSLTRSWTSRNNGAMSSTPRPVPLLVMLDVEFVSCSRCLVTSLQFCVCFHVRYLLNKGFSICFLFFLVFAKQWSYDGETMLVVVMFFSFSFDGYTIVAQRSMMGQTKVLDNEHWVLFHDSNNVSFFFVKMCDFQFIFIIHCNLWVCVIVIDSNQSLRNT